MKSTKKQWEHKLHKRIYLFVCFVFTFCGYICSQEKAKVDYNYLVYLPEDYAVGNKSYPLVIYLHGGAHKGNDLNKLKKYGLPYLVEKGNEFDFIIISPQCPDDKYWSSDNWFEPLFEKIQTEYQIDTDRVYLTGISMGGYGTFIVAMDHPDKFAAIVPLCGGCNDSDTPRICTLKNIPIWAFHGTNDNLIPISETERIINALDKCKGKTKFTKLEGEGHGIQYLYETHPQIYKWMLEQSRSGVIL
ncbi:putative peptidase [Parabacteroides sp. PF5-5]|uniref:carboxylesterase family protein n=1 Tax=unclassified Parabacteroides TaxID=2649774 RepID=UPI0024747BA5|nr:MULTISPECIES: prolyl oligopeptidase family serine peptidase [unclassified Parabacteroides]MDH6305823.1 putative peptidase [Parabacteroides sp. PH5-39]MDH6317363.1 putative peptidase [Parabacteroides sp. PF5-13]MDH6320571.1 putative peptidase [Parabacteroides sp. PH5-13]MDH6324266.1 putative peptidase [Parabacteroides sp. PH5-8]MDH6328463.1 putative peptidase [Parabacteroides sp. PH5-41]